MACDLCAFNQGENARRAPPCNNCDGRDRGYCLASPTPQGLRPVISNLFDEGRARQLIDRAAGNGTLLTLLCWSQEQQAYLPLAG